MHATITFFSDVINSNSKSPYRKFYAIYLLLLSAPLKDHQILSYIAKSGSLLAYIFDAAQHYSPKAVSPTKKADRFFSSQTGNNDAILSINFTRLCLEAIMQWAEFTDQQQKRNSTLEIFSQYLSYLKKQSNLPQDYWFIGKDYDLSIDISAWNFKQAFPPIRSADKDVITQETPIEVKTKNKPQIPGLVLQNANENVDNNKIILGQDEVLADTQSGISDTNSEPQDEGQVRIKNINNLTTKLPLSEDSNTSSPIQNKLLILLDLKARRAQTDLVTRGRTSKKKAEAHNIKNLFKDLSPQYIRSQILKCDASKKLKGNSNLVSPIKTRLDDRNIDSKSAQSKSSMSTSVVLKAEEDLSAAQTLTLTQSKAQSEAVVSISETTSTFKKVEGVKQTKHRYSASMPRRDFSREITECGSRIKTSIERSRLRMNTSSLCGQRYD